MKEGANCGGLERQQYPEDEDQRQDHAARNGDPCVNRKKVLSQGAPPASLKLVGHHAPEPPAAKYVKSHVGTSKWEVAPTQASFCDAKLRNRAGANMGGLSPRRPKLIA